MSDAYAPPAAAMAARPAVILWYRIYATAAALVYGVIAFAWATFSAQASGATDLSFAIQAVLYVTPVLVFYGVAAALPYKPWGWTYALVAIAFGLFTCLAPFSIALVIMWQRPLVKAAFRRL